MGNRADLFWMSHSKNKPEGFYSKSFKDIIQWLFSYNPMERPSIAEIRSHEWINGPVPTHDEVKEAFELRKSLLSQQNYQPEAHTPSGTPDESIYGKGAFRSLDSE